MGLESLDRIDMSEILGIFDRRTSRDWVATVMYRCEVPPVRSLNAEWTLLQILLSDPHVYETLGISTTRRTLEFGRSRGLEVIGTLANLLDRFVESETDAWSAAQRFLVRLAGGRCSHLKGFWSLEPWCDWFVDDPQFECGTVIVGSQDDWWLLAVQTPG